MKVKLEIKAIVEVSDKYDFNWDYVCLNDEDNYYKKFEELDSDLNSAIGLDILKKNNPNLDIEIMACENIETGHEMFRV